MSNLKVFIFSFLVIFSFIHISAQDDDPIKVDSSIVRLNVGVVNNKGRPITSLNKEDFVIYEDGVKQEISRFERGCTF